MGIKCNFLNVIRIIYKNFNKRQFKIFPFDLRTETRLLTIINFIQDSTRGS